MSIVPERVWCGIDLGTTNVKVLLLAEDGMVLWRESRRTPRVSDGIGPCADAETLLATIETMVLAASFGARLVHPLAGIAVGGTGEEGVPVNARGHAIDLAVPWFDRRATALVDEMAARPPWRDADIPVPLDYSRTAAKWAWARRYRPAPMRAAHAWVALTDYPAARWTRLAFMSESLAARTACWHVGRREWLAPLLADAGAPQLPPVRPGGTVIGGVRSDRLEAASVVDGRTEVVAGGHDHPMAAFAIRQLHADALVDSMGTAELLYGELPETRTCGGQPSPHRYFAFSRPIIGTGIACLGVTELQAELEPLLAREDEAGAQFRAVMAGAPVPGQPGKGPLPRHVLEHVTLGTRDRLAALAELGAPPGPLFTGGGWARSASFLRLRASMFGQPIHTVAEAELSAYGATLLAARALRAAPPVRLEVAVLDPDPELQRIYADPAFSGCLSRRKLINDSAVVVPEIYKL